MTEKIRATDHDDATDIFDGTATGYGYTGRTGPEPTWVAKIRCPGGKYRHLEIQVKQNWLAEKIALDHLAEGEQLCIVVKKDAKDAFDAMGWLTPPYTGQMP